MTVDPTIIVAVITGVLTLAGTIITVKGGNKDIQNELDKHNAVQDERITELTREVRKHNEFAERIPKLEAKVETMEKTISKLQEVK